MDRSHRSIVSRGHLFIVSIAAAFTMIPAYAAESAVPPWADEIVSLLIKVFGAALVALAALAVRKLGKKWGVENTEILEKLARQGARSALNFADRWAKAQDEKPSKGSKLERAVDRLIELEKLVGVTNDIRNALARRIETELEVEAKSET